MAENKIIKAELQDLSRELQELATDKEGCFYKYESKDFAGTKIYAALREKYKADGERFLFSNDFPENGTLSICQGLASVIGAIEDMEAEGEEQKQVLDNLIEQLFASIEKENGYKLTPSPYAVNNNFFVDHIYVDSATWVVSVILGIVRLNKTGKYDLTSNQKKKIAELYKYAINKINESFIPSVEYSRPFRAGWNFTDGCDEPSLYFTFAVSEILIDILDTFENVIRTADIDLIKEQIVVELDKKNFFSSEKYISQKDRIDAALAKAFSKDASGDREAEVFAGIYGFSSEEKRLIIEVYQKSRFIEESCAEFSDKYEKNGKEVQIEKEFFNLFNNGLKPYDSESPYSILEANCKKSAKNIWYLTKNNLSSEFYSSDLTSIISRSTIESSVSSDAVFNVIFVINTIINAGLDEDLEDRINYFTFNGSSAYNEAISEYDYMRDTLRLAYENCYQFYTHLRKNNKDYKINEYTLNFDEKFSKYSKLTNELRKSRIRVFSLMPLIVRTKTTIGEFLIQYPQYDMILFLEQILKYRCYDSETSSYIWIWESDGYSASSNYYFISALASFYDYYENYENAFIKNANKNTAAKKSIEEKYHKALIEKGKAVDKDVSEFEEQEKKIAELEEQNSLLANQIKALRDDPLRSALTGFVSTVIKETIIDILAAELSGEAKKIVNATKDSVISHANEYSEDNDGRQPTIEDWESRSISREAKTPFEKGMSELLIALLFEQLGETIYSVKPTNDEREKGLDSVQENIKYLNRDIRRALRYYMYGIADRHSSNFIVNRGESTLSPSDHRFLVNMIKDSQNKKGDEN